MEFSIGHLHSSLRLIELLSVNPIEGAVLTNSKDKFYISPLPDLINISLRCNWIELNKQGLFVVSKNGEMINTLTDYEAKLRFQIRDIIMTFQPAWSKSLIAGRKEFYRSVSRDITQCFKESGLFQENPSEMIVNFWDDLVLISRSFMNSELLKCGRMGERYTLIFESDRTGLYPKWQSLESNYSGYDILSVVSESDKTPLQIEVKASIRKLKDAKINITSHEWSSAISSRSFMFYLWLFYDKISLAVIDIKEMANHIPHDEGGGKWKVVEIPMRIFRDKFKNLDSNLFCDLYEKTK